MTGLSTRWTAAAVVGLTLVAGLSGGLVRARLASGEVGPQAVAAVAGVNREAIVTVAEP